MTVAAAAVRVQLRALPTASGPLRHLSDVAAALTQVRMLARLEKKNKNKYRL